MCKYKLAKRQWLEHQIAIARQYMLQQDAAVMSLGNPAYKQLFVACSSAADCMRTMGYAKLACCRAQMIEVH